MKRLFLVVPVTLLLCLSSGCARQKRMEAALIEKQARIDSLAKKNSGFSAERAAMRRTNAYLRVRIKQLQSTVKATSGYSEALVDVNDRNQAIDRGKHHIRQLNFQLRQKDTELDRMKRHMEQAQRQAEKYREELRGSKSVRNN